MRSAGFISRHELVRSLPRLSAFILLLTWCSALAQELEPRAYSPSPVGTTFMLVALARSSGDVTLDPSIPLTNVRATLYSSALGLGRTFDFLGRQALVTVALPYAWGNISGEVQERKGTVSRSGLADLKARFSVNLYGSPALSPKEFAKHVAERPCRCQLEHERSVRSVRPCQTNKPGYQSMGIQARSRNIHSCKET